MNNSISTNSSNININSSINTIFSRLIVWGRVMSRNYPSSRRHFKLGYNRVISSSNYSNTIFCHNQIRLGRCLFVSRSTCFTTVSRNNCFSRRYNRFKLRLLHSNKLEPHHNLLNSSHLYNRLRGLSLQHNPHFLGHKHRICHSHSSRISSNRNR